MLSRLQELRKEEETLLRLKAALHDQLNRLKVEELALQSMINSRGDEMMSSQSVPEQPQEMLVHVDNEASINQTSLELSTRSHALEEEEEEEEESDS
ncbi:PREDICTED: snRNA-activating protein complex subunit 5 [Chrysochloris asiatica]|uniref:snRNA-activating protein complex subunit 5 n=1 Tax=Chrysochloris asiatica TaxID=185453 RepID=A0A9B0WGQ3_CHRAS|nr:PREDICTED: snRNA-activating protein complex subunit 5 [Chrysochloris asiatica]